MYDICGICLKFGKDGVSGKWEWFNYSTLMWDCVETTGPKKIIIEEASFLNLQF